MNIGQGFETAVDWINVHAADFLNTMDEVLNGFIDLTYNILDNIPFVLFFVVVALVPLLKKNFKLSIFISISLLYIYTVGYWDATIQTLSIIFVGLVISLVVGIPLGILAAIYKRFDNSLRPILDFMQTMPSFVYLLPAVTFFGTGNVAAIVAIVIYSIAPVIRLTTLGIREVPTELLEASDAFGSTRIQKLVGVQIPVARSTIMTGVNQTIMMSLSMVVIAAMIGAEGLGSIVFTAVANLDLATAFESGLAIVFLAISLDRLTQLVNDPSANLKSIYKKLYVLILMCTLILSIGVNIYSNMSSEEEQIIKVATNDGWADHVALNALYTYIIETETDYTIVDESLDTTYIFSSIASSDNDLSLASWMPTSQVVYDKYKDDIEYISTTFDGARIGIVVPSYMTDVNSIADLKGRESEFNNVLFGIEPGSATAAIAEGVADAYDLDMKQSTSSTAAMLQELDNAITKEQDVVVTLWSPHWSFARYDIKMLEDPKGAMGPGDDINIYSRLGFADEYPEIVEMLSKVKLTNEQFSDLMDRLNGHEKADYNDIVASFLADNPDIYEF